MKKIKFLLMLLLGVVVSVSVASCSKDDDDDSNGGGSSNGIKGSATAVFDGKSIKVNWVQLWDGGPKFAEFNVGASSVGEYGCYYTWGGFKDKERYTQNTGNETLTGDFDTATMLWGSNWRMPTNIEFEALLIKCNISWTDDYNNTGKAGCVFTGKGDYSNNKVFFPAAGRYEYREPSMAGESGQYWSSTPREGKSGLAYVLWLESDEDNQYVGEAGHRETCYSVRAVLK